jgi:hypothetical protein
MNYQSVIWILIILFILLQIRNTKEHFRLTKDLVDKYFEQKSKTLSSQHEEGAWDHCADLMKLALKWSIDENEVPTIETKPFPCGNTVLKCLIKADGKIKAKQPLGAPVNLSIYLKD